MNHAEKILRRARNIIRRGRWGQGAYAVRKDGMRVHEWDPSACKFDIVGAVKRAGFDLKLIPKSSTAIEYLVSVTDLNPYEWNDAPGRTKAEVIAKLGEAADLTKPDGGES